MGFLFSCLISLIVITRFSCANEEIKSYKGYKAFKMYGAPEKLLEINGVLKSIGHNETITTFKIDELQALVSPTFMPQFENLTRNKVDKIVVVSDDFSEFIAREKAKSRKRGGNGSGGSSFLLTEYHSIDEVSSAVMAPDLPLLLPHALPHAFHTEDASRRGQSTDLIANLTQINAYLMGLSKKYEGVYLVVGGQSYENRKILGLRINGSSRKSSRHSLPGVFIEAGMHGREWSAIAAILYFINELVTGGKEEIKALRNSFDWHIFPVTNPDGYQYSFSTDRMWRKSRSMSSTKPECRGADLNRNWDHNWGVFDSVTDPCNPEMYAGTRAFSEIETETLSKYMRQMKKLDVFLAFHCDAECLLLPFADIANPSKNHGDLVRIGKTAVEYGSKVNGVRTKGPGTPHELLQLFVSGCSMDYAHKELKVPISFTYELRGEMFGWPQEKIPEQGNEVTQMILGIMVESGKLGYFDFHI